VLEFLIRGVPFWPATPSGLSITEFFELIEEFFDRDPEPSRDIFDPLIRDVKPLLQSNGHLPFVKRLLALGLSDENLLVLLLFSYSFVHYNNPVSAGRIVTYYKGKFNKRQMFCALIDGSHELVKRKYIEKKAEKIWDWEDDEDIIFILTGKAKTEFFKELPIAKSKVKKQDQKDTGGLISYKKLGKKTLCFNSSEQAQIDRIASLLEGDKYKIVQQRLSTQGFRSGFTCLFHGSPGTGKTETVYQLARRSRRNVMKIDIPAVIDSYVGQSEKNVRLIFDEYHEQVKKSRSVPILFFNEADGLLTKRASKDAANPAVIQMWNTMQNIILEEMESLDGIMIATTNLTGNLDKAFDRRFLFKIEFLKPDLESRRSIWLSLIRELSKTDADVLASRFDFTGGQIENVARKFIIENALTGKEPVLADLIAFCEDENSLKIPGRVGFNI
jgi:hypothetical protein